MNIREYSSKDFDSCLKVFRSNVPIYFTNEEFYQFKEWLKNPDRGPYYVLEIENVILGCGGTYFNQEENVVGLSWGMIDGRFHKRGFGKALTEFRLNTLRINYPGINYKIVTSQHTEEFYKHLGFTTIDIIKDGFGVGLDNHTMIKNAS